MPTSVNTLPDFADTALTYTGALALTNLVYLVSGTAVARADSGSGGTMPAIGVVTSLNATALTCEVATSGIVGGFSGLTPGDIYYAHTSGTIATTPGTVVQAIGVAISATQLQLFNDAFVLPNVYQNGVVSVDPKGNRTLGLGLLVTTATDGFPYLPTCAGTPTGVPTAQTGFAAAVYDTTAHKLWIYDGGWKFVAMT